MKIAFYLLIGIHGLIHILGFLQAFKLVKIDGFSLPISKPLGILWLSSFLLFMLTLVLLFVKFPYWWAGGISAILLSQILIFLFWQDAKFGTLLNIILLLPCIVGYTDFVFTKTINKERESMLQKAEVYQLQPMEELPLPVQNWLSYTGINENVHIKNVYLQQKTKMKLEPGQNEWKTAIAEQYFTINPPAFNWSVNLEMNPFFTIQGRDKFENGKGSMLMKLFSLVPIADVEENKKINQGALQRFLAEIVWFPTAALSPLIQWEQINEHTAKATMTYKGTSGSGFFHFHENGEFHQFTTRRYKGADENSKLHEWRATALEHKTINGIKVPVRLEVSWKLEDGYWTWLKLHISHLEYNTLRLPTTKH